jgi:PASTA domain-containing protein
VRVIALAAVLFLLAVSAGWGSAGAVARSATPYGKGHGSVSSVSCGAPGDCAAGGYYRVGKYREAFVVSETKWRWGRPIEVPGMATLNRGDAEVTSISCAAAGECGAGGYYSDRHGIPQAFVATEINGRWGDAIEVPRTATLNQGDWPGAGVDSISCTASGECAAGGHYAGGSGGIYGIYGTDGQQAFVVSETKGRWGKAIEVPGLAKLNSAGDATVTAISCAAPGKCAAGGYTAVGNFTQQAFLVSERNGRWSKAIEVPGISALDLGSDAFVTSVSCAPSGHCAATGLYTPGYAGQEAFVVDETNGTWGNAIDVPGLATLNSGGFANVNSISCVGTGACSAGGSYADGTYAQEAFVADEAKGIWHTAVRVPGSTNASVDSISCAAARTCAAGGSYYTGGVYTDGSHARAFLAGETKGSWGTAFAVPGMASIPSTQADVKSISCAAAGACAAGGYISDPTFGKRAFVVTERNGSWGRAIELQFPVSCVVPEVVGKTLAAAENRLEAAGCSLGKITHSYSRRPPGRVVSEHPPLGTVLSAGTAVGLTVSKGPRVMPKSASAPLSHVKTRWRATLATLPANAATGESQDVSITSIVCARPGNCTAVGSYVDKAGNQQGLLLAEKAGHWARGVKAALPADAPSDPQVSLTSVSCPSVGNCTAVGTYANTSGGIYGEGGTSGLLLTETAGHWGRGVEAVLPGGGPATYVRLQSVSCASAGNCTAVGSSDFRGLMLTESAGHWKRGVAFGAPDADSSDIKSVSCSSGGSCSAVGYDDYITDPRFGYDTAYALLLTKEKGKWSEIEILWPEGRPFEGSALTSVSCTTPGNCSAIGGIGFGIDEQYAPTGVLLTEKAGTWGRGVGARPPKNVDPGYISTYVGPLGISCSSPGNCLVMGAYYSHDRQHLASWTEQGGTWRRGVEVPLPRGAWGPDGIAISCASAGYCTVVGSYYTANPYDVYGENAGPHGFLLTESAGRWARGLKTSVASDFAVDSVSSVSCPSPGHCGAVGVAWNSDGPTYGVLFDSTTAPCVVPRLIGKTLSAARHSIESHNCSVGRINDAPSSTIETGHVISQTPAPGRHLPPGTTVDLTVSR